MGRQYFALELNTNRLNLYVEKNQLMDASAHPNRVLRLRAHMDDLFSQKIVAEIYQDEKIDPQLKTPTILNEIKKRFLFELNRYAESDKDNAIKNIYQYLNSFDEIESFIANLSNKLDIVKSPIPTMLIPLAKFLVGIYEVKDESEAVVKTAVAELVEKFKVKRQKDAILDISRGYYFKQQEINNWNELKEKMQLNDKLNEYFFQYAHQKGFAHVGNLTINDMLSTILGGQQSHSIVEVISPQEFYYVTYTKFFYWETNTKEQEVKGDVVAAICSIVHVKDMDPASDDITTILCEMPDVVFEAYNPELEKALWLGWLISGKENLFNRVSLSRYEKEAVDEWVEIYRQKNGTFNYLNMPLVAMLALEDPNRSEKKYFAFWLEKHKEERYLKLTIKELWWILKYKPELTKSLLDDPDIYMRIILSSDYQEFKDVKSFLEKEAIILEKNIKFQQFLTDAKLPIEKQNRVYSEEDNALYFSGLYFLIQHSQAGSVEEQEAINVLVQPAYIASLEDGQFLELILCGNENVARALLAPWLYAKGSFWQRFDFSTHHPNQNLEGDELASIAIKYPSLWAVGSSVFGKRSWFKESWLGQKFFGKPLRYKLTKENYERIWHESSSVLKNNIIALAKQDSKFKNYLLATEISQIRSALKKTVAFSEQSKIPPARDLMKAPQKMSTSYENILSHNPRKHLKRAGSDRGFTAVITRELLLHGDLSNLLNLLKNSDKSKEEAAIEEAALYFLSDIEVREALTKRPEILKFIIERLHTDKNQLILGLIAHVYDYKKLGNFPVHIYSFVALWQAKLVVWLKAPQKNIFNFAEIDKTNNLLKSALEEGELFELLLLFRNNIKLIQMAILCDVDWSDKKLKTLGNYLVEHYIQLRPQESSAELRSLYLQAPKFVGCLGAERQAELFQALSGKQLHVVYMHTTEEAQIEISGERTWISKILMGISPTEIEIFLDKNKFAMNDLINVLKNEYEEKAYIKMLVHQQISLLGRIFALLSDEAKSKILSDEKLALQLIEYFDDQQLAHVLLDLEFRVKIYNAMLYSPYTFISFLKKFDVASMNPFHEEKIIGLLLRPNFLSIVIDNLDPELLTKLLKAINFTKVYSVFKNEQNSMALYKFLQKIDIADLFLCRYNLSSLNKSSESEIAELLSDEIVTRKLIEVLNANILNALIANVVFKERIYVAMRGEKHVAILDKFLEKINISFINDSPVDLAHMNTISADPSSIVQATLTKHYLGGTAGKRLGALLRRSPSPQDNVPNEFETASEDSLSSSPKRIQSIGKRSRSFNNPEELRSLLEPRKSSEIRFMTDNGTPPSSGSISSENSDADSVHSDSKSDDENTLQESLRKVESTGTKTSASSSENEELANYSAAQNDNGIDQNSEEESEKSSDEDADTSSTPKMRVP